ncbi:GumC family protein [Limimaricola litoreus]|uniref:non-specific protein-tyrosine kinase n=1 Tax=Limimaricola litoreus TaxID=2955316 RepID=A0A9X2FQE7_9RHOB|nr:polysaccharide biosynthesis tyrosine autokinase [Limimaricola litoreus]MCP1169292.1 polysaccharide biosynthesis tyrosine autokinase [Limimaricola litoreus]
MNSRIRDPRKLELWPYSQNTTDIALDFGEIFNILRRGWWIIAAAGFIGTLIAVILVLQVPPSYTASAKLLLGQKGRVDDSMGTIFPDLKLDDAAVSGEIAILTSGRMLAQVSEALDLRNRPEFNKAPDSSSPNIVDAATDWAVGLIKGAIGPASSPGTVSSSPSDVPSSSNVETAALTGRTTLGEQAEYVGQLSTGLRVSQEGRSNLLNIRYISENRLLAAAIPNALVDIYLEDQLNRRFGILSRMTSGLEVRLETMRRRLEDAERAVIEIRNENLADGFGDRMQLERQISELSIRLGAVTAEYAEQVSELSGIDAMIAENGPLSTVGLFTSPMIDGLQATLSELRERASRLRSEFNGATPSLVSVRAEIKRLETDLSEEIMRIRDDRARMVQLAAGRRAAIQGELRALERQAIAQADREVRLAQLEREQDAARLVYETFLDRFTETREIVDIDETGAEIIDYAAPPASPFSPNKKLSAALGGIAGVSLGIGLVFLLHLSRNRTTSMEELQRLLPAFTVLSMPRLKRLFGRSNPLIVALRDKPSPFSEAVRSLRTAVLLASPTKSPLVVSVVSPLAGAGKTTTAINLARSVSRMGRSCILIDADLRRGDIARHMGLRSPFALNDLLEDDSDLAAAVRRDPETNLCVITARHGARDPSGALLGNGLQRLVGKLKKHFEVIIIDTAPLLKVSDTQPILHLTDTLVMVIPHNSRVDEIRAAVGKLADIEIFSQIAVYSKVPERNLSPYY